MDLSDIPLHPTYTERPASRKSGGFSLLYGVVAMIVLLLLIGSGLSIKLYLDAQTKVTELERIVKAAPNAGSGDQAVIDAVGRHLVLPDETPKVVTLTGVASLKKLQPFFAPATDGDALLVYSQKVILYSPKLDKVIDVTQIRVNGTGNETSLTTQEATVAGKQINDGQTDILQ